MEVSGGKFKFQAHSLHHLPQLHPWILGRSWHRYLHPRDKTDSVVSGLEGGFHVCDISVPAQGIRRLVQGQMPVNTIWIRHGVSGLPDPQDVLGLAADGRKSRGVLWVGLPGLYGGDSGGPAVPHHIQRVGGCGGE